MEWIDVKDRLPEVLGEAVLLWADFDNSSQDCKIGFLVQESYRGVIRDIDPSPLWSINGEFKTWPTHWQPLPAPPEASAKETQ